MNRDDLNRLLRILADLDGSDMHIKAGAPPRVRVDGLLRTLDDEPEFTAEDTLALASQIMPPKIFETFEERREADFAYAVPGLGRFRTNAFYQRSSVALAMRRVQTNAATFDDLRLPDVVRRLSEHHRGLVLVTGPTGSGKTTTLAAMVDHINHVRACHIITIEDPIEYLHKDDLAAIDQREVGFDTDSFSSAMRTILRQDPDVILVGEMRDPETVHRIVDFFPPHQQGQVRVSLAGALTGTICQRLIPRADGKGRVPALEIMVVNGRIQQAILDPVQTSDINEIMAEGEYYGMQTFDQSLAELLRDEVIDLREAMNAASNPHDLKVRLERMGIVSTGRGFVSAAAS